MADQKSEVFFGNQVEIDNQKSEWKNQI